MTAPSIGKYLLDRLLQCGVKHIFGVPGDYILRLDKLIEQHEIRFINTIRENTAGYAADAYARMNGIGAACITYGVGINITNALAQAYVENSPVVVISGTVGAEEFKKHSTLHHLINKSVTSHGDDTQMEVFKQVTVDQGRLDNPQTAAEIIDRVLLSCYRYKKPVYLEIPRNLVDTPITQQAPITPFSYPPSDPDALIEALEETVSLLNESKRPLIWAGHQLLTFGLGREIVSFAEANSIPIVSTLLGKSVVDENHPLFVGVYQGQMSPPNVEKVVEEADCVLIAGVIMHDLDTGIFTAKLDHERRIEVNDYTLKIGHHTYPQVSMVDYIRDILQIKLHGRFEKNYHKPRSERLPGKFIADKKANTTTKRLFECLQSHLTHDHILVSDVGDCLFGSSDLVLTQHSFIACAYFASMGFALPAVVGAQFAKPDKRIVAVIGDGGFQMNAMELATSIRYGLDPIIIIMNNHGFGTERPLLEGSYNDILNWNYTAIPTVLGGGIGIKVETETQLEEAFDQAFKQKGTCFLIEVELGKMDFSPALQRLGELLGKVVKA